MSNSPAPQNSPESQPPATRESEPVDLLGYLKRLGRYWIAGLVAAVIVAGALFGYGATKSSSPVGGSWAMAHVMVTLPEPTTEALGAASSDAGSRVLSSYVAVDDSDVLMKDTAKRLGDSTDLKTLKAATSLYTGGGSQVLAVYALGTDQGQAEKRADAYAQAVVDNGSTLLPPAVKGLGTPTFTIVEKAGPSTASPDPEASSAGSGSSLLGSPVVAVVAGVVVGLVVMGVLEFVLGRRRV